MKRNIFSAEMLNLVKIWGCGWLAFIINFVPMYIIRGTTHSYFNEIISDIIVYIAVTFFFLSFFSVKEGRQLNKFDLRYVLTVAVIPSVLHLIIIVATKGIMLFSTLAGSTYILFQSGFDKEIFMDDLPAVEEKYVLIVQPIYEIFHIAAIITGYYIGYRKRKKERDALISERTAV